MHFQTPLAIAVLASLGAASPHLQERQNTLPTLSLVANGTGLASAASQLDGYTTLSFANGKPDPQSTSTPKTRNFPIHDRPNHNRLNPNFPPN